MRSPSHEQQVRLFAHLQQLLVEGEFVSTYKYALLIALARWALEHPDHDERTAVPVAALAPYFAELYWPQARPFAAPDAAADRGVAAETAPVYGDARPPFTEMLVQERAGQRPRVLKLVLDEQQRGVATFRELRPERRSRLLREVTRTITQMPLRKLQKVRGGQELTFLYRCDEAGNELVFEPGVVRCLAGFAPFVEELVRAAWLRFVLRHNRHLLGTPAATLEQFLFPDGRSGLAAWRPALQAVQGTHCFYCHRGVQRPVVDHFLPWSRYPRDLGHNLVLADDLCNARKSDHLAAVEHLERWCRRNEADGERLAALFDEARLPHDLGAVRGAARSLYAGADDVGLRVWTKGRVLVALDPRWRRLLPAG